MEPFQWQQSVWSLIKECVPDSELPEIRAVLGDALIDMYTEIYSEVQMWQQIWLDVHDGKSQMSQSSLTDPPAVKELLRSELQLLLLSLRQKATTMGRDDEVMSRYSPRVVCYALGTERQRSPHSVDCTTPNSRPESSRSSSSSRLSSHSSVEDEIRALRHKLNITDIDHVLCHLKSLLTEECEVLKNDIQLLQESVEQEYLKQSSAMEPSLTELKTERRLIQCDLEALNFLNESVFTNMLKAHLSPLASRKRRLKTLSEKKPSVSPETDSLQPKPPSYENRAIFLGKTRQRLSLSATQLSGSSPNLAPRQTPDLEKSSIQSVPQTVPASSAMVQSSESEIEFVGSMECIIKDKALHGHFRAAPIPMIPSPPAGQRGSIRGQCAGRRLARHQTEQPALRYVKSLASDVKPTNR